MRPVDPRLLRHAGAARGYLAVVVVLGLTLAALVLAQAGLLARALAGAAPGTGPAALWPVLAFLLVVMLARAAATYGGEVAALRTSARGQEPVAPPSRGPGAPPGPGLARRPAGR